MIKKILGIIGLIGIMMVINGCSDKEVVNVNKEIKNKDVMSEVIKSDCLKRFEFKSNQVHKKKCGKECKSEMKWIYTDDGIEVFKKWECGFGMYIEYNKNGVGIKELWGFRR